MSNAIIHIEGLRKQYEGASKPAVDNLNLEINSGAVFGLLGPNGAGKSTMIMMLCGLMKPDAGKISIMDMNARANGQIIRKKIGVAPQEIALFPTLTAYENLFYFGRMYGLPSSAIKASIENYLHVFGLTDKRNKRVQTFSGGMKRRLNLIAALLHDPSVLILDEPTAGVDVQSRNMVVDFLQTLKSKGVTIIYSSHFLEEAEKLCTDIAVVDEGKLIVRGTLPQIMHEHPDCHSLEQLFLKLTGKNIRD